MTHPIANCLRLFFSDTAYRDCSYTHVGIINQTSSTPQAQLIHSNVNVSILLSTLQSNYTARAPGQQQSDHRASVTTLVRNLCAWATWQLCWLMVPFVIMAPSGKELLVTFNGLQIFTPNIQEHPPISEPQCSLSVPLSQVWKMYFYSFTSRYLFYDI